MAAVCIDLTEDADLEFWTAELSCNSSELLLAIQTVGIRVDAVKNYLMGPRGEETAS